MECSRAAVLLLLLVLAASGAERVVESSAFDCMDACTTGCVQSNTRLMSRCERKCAIRCGPAAAVDGSTRP